jgi:hypothetical protein
MLVLRIAPPTESRCNPLDHQTRPSFRRPHLLIGFSLYAATPALLCIDSALVSIPKISYIMVK